jgi:hypothetical protein
MKETLFNANGKDQTRIRRAFRWVITFRDFPAGSWQTVDGNSMMTEALTLFTRGRAEFYLDGVRRGDREPGVLSTEHEVVGAGGTFELRYVEPTTRLCIPANINNKRLPTVRKTVLVAGESFEAEPMGQYLVCLGSVQIGNKTFTEEQSFVNGYSKTCTAITDTILLEFKRETA